MNAAAPWLLPTNGRITVTVKPGIGAYTRFRTRPAVPWLHVRNQEKRFAHEHFAFAHQEKRFAREHFAFARQEKRFAREHFAFARQEKRFARKRFAFARQEKRFPRCRRTGAVFRRSVHPPADPAWPSARVRPPGHSKSNNFFKNFHERCIFRPLSPVLWVEESFFNLGERLVGSSRHVGRALRTHAHYVCVRLRRGRDRGDSSYQQDLRTAS